MRKRAGSAADTQDMKIGFPSSSPPETFRARYEKLLRKSPRTLEIACALGLSAIALEFLVEVVFGEWFYFQYHRDYAYTLESRLVEWAYGLCAVLLALWMLGIAWTLLRGTSRRWDQGLISPPALRIWGLLFAILPLMIVLAAPHAIAHFHILFWCVVASGACFALAARRARVRPAAPEPVDPGPRAID